MDRFGYSLSIAYNELVDSKERSYYTERLRERRGVMTIHDFYSNILRIDCNTEHCTMSDEQWLSLDHSCLKTAVNGVIFRDDSGQFTAFRELLLGYYPDKVWKIRMAEQLHEYSATLQVNYSRCMARGDTVAAEICRIQGLKAAMDLFFLLKREYPPDSRIAKKRDLLVILWHLERQVLIRYILNGRIGRLGSWMERGSSPEGYRNWQIRSVIRKHGSIQGIIQTELTIRIGLFLLQKKLLRGSPICLYRVVLPLSGIFIWKDMSIC